MRNVVTGVLMAVLAVLLAAAPAPAVLVTFDAIDTSAGPQTVMPDFLAAHGISSITIDSGVPSTHLEVVPNPFYLVTATSPNWFAAGGTNNDPHSYTFHFASPIPSFGFSTLGVNPAFPTLMPEWSATAFNTSNAPIQTVGQPLLSNFGSPPFSWMLEVPGQLIDHVTIFSNNHHVAGVSSMGLDNLSFESTAAPVPEPGTLLLLGSGIAGLGVRAWRKRSRRSPSKSVA